jgi:hypothetical protein
MSNLFVRLAKFRGRPEKSSIENFFTELVAELLRQEKAILDVTLETLLKGSAALPLADHVKVWPQVPTRSPRPVLSGLKLDLLLECPTLNVIIENKVGSTLTKGQLERYLAYAEETDRSKVAVISRDRCPVAEECDHRLFLGPFFWSDLADVWWARRQSVSNRHRYLLEGVLEFMKEQYMGIVEPFEQEELRAPDLWSSFSRKLRALVQRLSRRLEAIGDPGEKKDFHSEAYCAGPSPEGGLNEPGMFGTLWSSPVGTRAGDCDFWYFVGFRYPPYREWLLPPLPEKEPEAVVAVGMWPSSDLGRLEEQVRTCVGPLLASEFRLDLSENQASVWLCRRRPLRELPAEADSASTIIEFLESSHRTLVASGLIPRLHELIRQQRRPLPTSPQGDAVR